MPPGSKNIIGAAVIALLGLILTVVAFLDAQSLIGGLCALVTAIFIVCIVVIERSRTK